MTDYAEPSEAACATLRAALVAILDDPDGWDQGTWGRRRPCGTTYCLAGHVAVIVLGLDPAWSPLRLGDDDGEAYLFTVRRRRRRRRRPGDPAPSREGVDVAAARALDMVVRDDDYPFPDARADALFSGDRSLRRLLELAYLYTDGRVDLLDRYAPLAAARPDVAARDATAEATSAHAYVAALRSTRAAFADAGSVPPPTSEVDWWERNLRR